ncbi:MAG: class I SAM-dependent methyltransferase [Acidimicrobiales bacterium]|nr:class I SAM-dependent methyltransferase [Acidimicrobiales bacterium]
MDADEYRRMAEAGARHWWYRTTRLLLAELLLPHLDRHGAGGPPPLVLDAGGGTGATGGWMTGSAATVLADIEPMALDVARHDFGAHRAGSHGLLPVQADLNRLPFADAAFDAVLCVTALCHRMNPDPGAIVRDFARITKPGGVVCLWEPGGRRLWRGHDEVTHTGRRFSVGDLRDLAVAAGLSVERSTGAYTFLVPPAALIGLIERGAQTSDVGRHEGGLGGVFPAMARAERWLLRRADLPFGLSAITVARRPD